MPRLSKMITQFNAGELSPRVHGHVDKAFYENGARRLENMIATLWGGAERRGGTRFIQEVKDSTKRVALAPFEFAEGDAYQFEIGENYLRFLKDRGRVVVADTDAAITNGTFDADIADWDDKSTGLASIAHDATNNRLDLEGAAGEVAWAEQEVATTATGVVHVLKVAVHGAAGDSVAIRVGTASEGEEILADKQLFVGFHLVRFTPTSDPFFIGFRNAAAKTISLDNISLIDDAQLELETPWDEADLFDADAVLRLKFDQSIDVVYLTHPTVGMHKLSRFTNEDWSLEELDLIDGPYLDENTDTAKTLNPGAQTGLGIALVADGFNPFKATDVGRLVRFKHTTNWGYARIVGFTDDQNVTIDIKKDFDGATAKSTWQFGLYSNTTGWPNANGFHQERLQFGGSKFRPTRFDGSQSNDFENFTPGSDDGDAIGFNIASDKANPIEWFASSRGLLMGTRGAEWTVTADTIGTAITPSNISVSKATQHGSSKVPPVVVSTAVLFWHRFRKNLFELAFRFDVDAFNAPDMTRRAEHITLGGIVSTTYQQHPYSIIWSARADGTLLGFTYERDQEALGWHRHPLGGDGRCEQVSVITGDGRDELWMIVRRTINGVSKRYIEVLEDPLRLDEPQADAFYVDSGLTLDNTIPVTLTPDETSGAAVTFTAGAALFVSGDVGRFIRHRYQDGNDEIGAPVWKDAVAEIKVVTDTTHVVADIMTRKDFPSTDTIAADAWRLTVTQITGLDHIEGESAQVLGDGAVQAPQVVSGGAITLAEPAATVHVGLQFISIVSPMRLEVQSQSGTIQGKLQRTSRVIVRLLRSLGFSIGPNIDEADEVPFRTTDDAMDTAIPLFTGDKAATFPGKSTRDGLMEIIEDQPLPLQVLALVPEFQWGPRA